MAIVWTPKLSVGVPHIDDEHKELFARVNRLLEAMQASRAREELAPLVAFLEEYVTVHFAGERALMAARHYPGLAEHLEQHAYFVTEFQALTALLREEGPSAMLHVKLSRLLCDWLRDHVGSTDKALGAFLAAGGR
jgi:hemerythrin